MLTVLLPDVGSQSFPAKYFLLFVLFEISNGAQLRKSHPIELTIKSGSIRGEYLVSSIWLMAVIFFRQLEQMTLRFSKAFRMQREELLY